MKVMDEAPPLRSKRLIVTERGIPYRGRPQGNEVAVGAAGVTTCRGAEESSVQDEGRQGNRLNPRQLREMRRGPRGRKGNWRAGCLETRTSRSGRGRRKRTEHSTSPTAYSTFIIRLQRSKNSSRSRAPVLQPMRKQPAQGMEEAVHGKSRADPERLFPA